MLAVETSRDQQLDFETSLIDFTAYSVTKHYACTRVPLSSSYRRKPGISDYE